MNRITPYTHSTVGGVSKDVRLCIQCRHARHPTGSHDKDLRCTLFKNVDVITGETKHELAIHVRKDENACGLSGKLYEDVIPRQTPDPYSSFLAARDDEVRERETEKQDGASSGTCEESCTLW